MRLSSQMIDCKKWDVSDDVTQLQLDEPVLGRHQGAEVIQQTESNSAVARFQEKSNEVLDAR